MFNSGGRPYGLYGFKELKWLQHPMKYFGHTKILALVMSGIQRPPNGCIGRCALLLESASASDGFEPWANLGVECQILKNPKKNWLILERVMGIEPTLFAWEAKVLPLNYTRVGADYRSGSLAKPTQA